MSIEFTTENKEGFLLVKTHGESNDIKDVLRFAGDVIRCCKETKYLSILIDERDREYNLTDVQDQNKMANFLSSLNITDLKIAFLCQQKYQEQVRFLEIAAKNRGLKIRFFVDPDIAEEWLTRQSQA